MIINKDTGKQILGELYSGPGGIGLGAAMSSLKYQGIHWRTEPRWMNDMCSDTCATWSKNILGYEREFKNFKGEVDIYQGDVRKLELESLAPIDGLIFGFPCNDFSSVGEQKGLKGNFGPLYSYGIEVLRKSIQPSWFIAENVSGITASDNGNALKKILFELRSSGYRITTHKYCLEKYGIPQARHRIIIVGFRDDLNLTFKVPKPSNRIVSAAEALANIPIDAANNEYTNHPKRIVERLSFIDPGENCWNAHRMPDRLKLNVAGAKLSQIYKKLDPKKPAYTVTGSGGGGTHMYHWAENRALTNRERARLQTFPDSFEFIGSKESVRRQIGMAIPVLAGQLIVTAVLRTLAGAYYESVAPNIDI